MRVPAIILPVVGLLAAAGLYLAAGNGTDDVMHLWHGTVDPSPSDRAGVTAVPAAFRAGREAGNASPIPAQYVPGSDAPGSTPPPAGSAGSPDAPDEAPAPEAGQAVDETALRYFAQKGDTRRLEAEIARLRALYPDWRPPADPLAVPQHGDPRLDAMWKLYSDNKLAQLRKAIGDRQAADPSWQVPADLIARLELAEGRERLVNASDLKQYDTVIRVAAEFPSLLTCADVDVLWRLAEAFANSQKPDRARDAYLYILRSCDNPAERRATLAKAIPLLSRAAVDELLATERTGPDGKGEFLEARADLLRRSVAAAGKDPSAKVEAGDVAGLEEIARRDGRASDDLLLGWYYLAQDDAARAADWFGAAHAKDDTAEAAQGYGLSLVRLKRPAEAEDLLHRWQDGSDDIRKTYLAAVAEMLSAEPRLDLAAPVLQRIVAAVAASRDAAAAQQLGWYARAFDQHQTAQKWFATALSWKPDDEVSAYGLALSDWQLGDKAGLARLKHEWAGRSERIAALGGTAAQARRDDAPSTAMSEVARMRQGGGRPAAAVPTRRDAGKAVPKERVAGARDCTSSATMPPANADAALVRGWCLMELNRPAEAAVAFEAALATQNDRQRSEAAWGQALAYLRSGLTDEAALAAAKAPQPRGRAIELEAAILSQRATSFFEARRYAEALLALDQRSRIAAERRDLMALRGYAYLNLQRLGDARQVFQALADAGDREGPRGLAAIEDIRRR